MKELYNKLKNYNIEDAIKIEESDRQYIALQKLYIKISDRSKYLSLILINSIICYQLSGKGEDYWEEFSEYFGNMKLKENIILEVGNFIKQSKNNKRFIEAKIKRINKLEIFIKYFEGKEEYYYDNMVEFRNELAKIMNQKVYAKTIVFSVKMFSYGARNQFEKLNYFPEDIKIPIDSRLINLFEKYKGDYTDINKFYTELSKKILIVELHLDAIIWVKYNSIIN